MKPQSIFGNWKQKEVLVAVLDVGSSSIGGALVLFSEGKKPSVLYTTRHNMSPNKQLNLKRIVFLMEKTLEAVVGDMLQDGLPHLKFTKRGSMTPDEVFCIFSSPWHASYVRTITLSQKDPFEIKRETIAQLIEREVNSIKKSQTERNIDEEIQKGVVELIEKEAIQVKLNGYEVVEPFGLKANTLKLLLYVSIVPTEILEKVRNITARAFRHKNIIFHSFTLSFYDILRDIWNHEKNFFFVEISGELTEISLVRDGALVESASFPIGRNFFVREIASVLKISMHEALSFLNMYITKKGSKEVESRLRGILKDSRQKWIDHLDEAVESIGDKVYAPNHIFLVAIDPLERWFANALKNRNSNGVSLTDSDVTVNLLNHKTLSHFIHTNKSIETDPLLLIDTLFAKKIYYLR